MATHDYETFSRDFAQYQSEGFVIIPSLLSTEFLRDIRAALAPHLDNNILGRNDFEGLSTNRVYALASKGLVFSELITHPVALAFAEAELGRDCLLSACLAINLLPGETAQAWHFDDSHYEWPRPRRALGVSAFWSIDETTADNGATELIPRSHMWGAEQPDGAVTDRDFVRGAPDPDDRGIANQIDAVKAVMPPGSLLLAKGTLWHRGGANRSTAPRLIITPQYCPGWTRPLENMSLAVPPDIARTLPQRAQELLGYSIRPPFMGYVDGRHPKRLLA